MSEPTAAMPTPAGDGPTVLGGRYRLENVAGRGGMAEVWRAHDTVLDRTVAVKWFTPGAGDVAAPARQQAEMKLLAGFNHPGLVTVYDAGVQPTQLGDRPYVVMEFVDGPTLAARLTQGPLPATAVTAIGSSVADALAYVHQRGVVHRDIKPGNILLEGGSDAGPTTVKLADFGIARLVDDARVTKTGMTVGTASYLSPEQVRGEEVTPKSDVYSLALVLLEAFTGRVEYPGSPVEAAVARLNRDPVVPGRLGPVWGPLLAQMTARDPALRPSAREVADRLAGTPGATAAQSATTSFIPPTGATVAMAPTGAVPRPQVVSTGGIPRGPVPPVRPLPPDVVVPAGGGDERPPRPLWPWIVLLLALIVIGAVIAFAVGLGSDNGGDTGGTTSPSVTSSAPTTPSSTAPTTPTRASTSPSVQPTQTATVTESVTPTPTPTTTPPTTTPPPSTSPPPTTSSAPSTSTSTTDNGGGLTQVTGTTTP